MHVMLDLAGQHGMQLKCAPVQNCAHNITCDWGLMVRAVDLAVAKICASWTGGALDMRLPVAAALTYLKVQTKGVHAETKDAVHTNVASRHGIGSGMLTMRGRHVSSKPLSTAQITCVLNV
jgi:hypothetical protein